MQLEVQTGRYASDEDIASAIVAGNTMLFEILIRRYNGVLYKLSRTYGFRHHESEDLMQETHITVYKKLHSFRREASFKTWITRIHLHHCYHKLNKGYMKYEEPSGDLPATAGAMFQSPGDTDKAVLNRELSKVLEQNIEALPVTYREVFVLREIEGFSVAETSAILGITEINTKVRLNRAKALLQKQLENVYSSTDIYNFNLIYCDAMVRNVMNAITKTALE